MIIFKGRHRRQVWFEPTVGFDPPTRAKCGVPRHVGCPACAPMIYAAEHARHRADRP